jgi:hypothetical protein
LLLAVVLAGAAVQERTGPVELPGKARDALSDKWKTWVPAELDPQAAGCLQNSSPPAMMLSADLDGDGQTDYATIVHTADGVRLVALVHRLWGYVVHDLDELGAAQASGALALEPRGGRFTTAGGLDDYYPAPTIVARRCGQPEVAYLWTGFSFRRTPITRASK